jgi:hypothetical protein
VKDACLAEWEVVPYLTVILITDISSHFVSFNSLFIRYNIVLSFIPLDVCRQIAGLLLRFLFFETSLLSKKWRIDSSLSFELEIVLEASPVGIT